MKKDLYLYQWRLFLLSHCLPVHLKQILQVLVQVLVQVRLQALLQALLQAKGRKSHL